MSTDSFKEKISLIEEIIYSYLPSAGAYDERITEAVNYSVKAGGKRLRPLLMQESYMLFAGNGQSGEDKYESEMLHRFMAAIEFIHTYSLVHDDLPAMDNDDLRRGKPTTHKMYGEAFGVLAGDALLNLAFETVLEGASGEYGQAAGKLSASGGLQFIRIKKVLSALGILASKAGIHGMIGGQCLDVYTEKTDGAANDLDEIMYIYENKTAALLEASCMIGACLAGADRDQIKIMEEFASHLGMAFQIRDDILDIISTDEILGKPVGSDAKNAKQTYAILRGVDEAQHAVEEYTDRAMACLDRIQGDTEGLKNIAMYLINREK